MAPMHELPRFTEKLETYEYDILPLYNETAVA